MKRGKLLLILLIIVGVIIGAEIIKKLNEPSGKYTYTIEVVPKDSQITVNGDQKKAGTYRTNETNLQIEYSKPGFATEKRNVTLYEDIENYSGVVMQPSEDRYRDWYQNNNEDRILSSAISSRGAGSIADQQKVAYPILSVLPYEGVKPQFRVDIGRSQRYPDDPTKVSIIVSGDSALAYERAIEWIRSKGFDPGEYEIIFSGIYNIFNPQLEGQHAD